MNGARQIGEITFGLRLIALPGVRLSHETGGKRSVSADSPEVVVVKRAGLITQQQRKWALMTFQCAQNARDVFSHTVNSSLVGRC